MPLGLIGMTRGDQIFGHRDHFGDIGRGAGHRLLMGRPLDGGLQRPNGGHVIQKPLRRLIRDIANATSLLMRLELEGISVGERWAELADLAQNRIDDGCLVFADLHYMLALTGGNRTTDSQSLLTRFSQDATKSGEMNKITADPGVAAAIGLNAFAEGRYSEAFNNLAAARPNLQAIGGSHAQRDVFERITIDAGLRAGHYEQTEAILTHRLVHRGGAEDSFAVSRFTALDTARLDASRIPAQ